MLLTRREFCRDFLAAGFMLTGAGIMAGCVPKKDPDEIKFVSSQQEFFTEAIPDDSSIESNPIIFFTSRKVEALESPEYLGDVPYFCQSDAFFQSPKYCAARSACGRTSVAMLLAFKEKIPNTKEDVYPVINDFCGGSSPSMLQTLAAKYGLKLEYRAGKKEDGTLRGTPKDPAWDKEGFKEFLQHDPVIVAIPGHWLVVVGWEDSKVILNDPYPPRWEVLGCQGKIAVPEDRFWDRFGAVSYRVLYPVED